MTPPTLKRPVGDNDTTWLETDSTIADDATDIIAPDYLQICTALMLLDTQTGLLYGEGLIRDCQIVSAMNDIRMSIEDAGRHFESEFNDHDYSSDLHLFGMDHYTVEQDEVAHDHTLSRQAMFQKLVGDVLRKEIFEIHLLNQVRKTATVANILAILRQSKLLKFACDYAWLKIDHSCATNMRIGRDWICPKGILGAQHQNSGGM